MNAYHELTELFGYRMLLEKLEAFEGVTPFDDDPTDYGRGCATGYNIACLDIARLLRALEAQNKDSVSAPSRKLA